MYGDLKSPAGRGGALASTTAAAFRSLWKTFQALRRQEGALRFLAAFFLYNDGIVTVISFSAIYAVTTLGFSMAETLELFTGCSTKSKQRSRLSSVRKLVLVTSW